VRFFCDFEQLLNTDDFTYFFCWLVVISFSNILAKKAALKNEKFSHFFLHVRSQIFSKDSPKISVLL